ncbi:MAG TPA: hypothetical protein PKU97_23310 [Kofleriaceae bacterium]|nr:hypothetical protein [Kofleriaceae bacterium]
MKAIKFAAILASVLTFAVASPRASATSVPTEDAYTCHELCRIKCIRLYPGNPNMQNLCTWSCIDQDCGGGPFPVE